MVVSTISAYSFIKRTMTMNGINNSPNGQPAMYEYRISDKNNPETYGRIDKPQFLWAGGWYLYTIFNLFGLRENEWNISFAPYIPKDFNKINFPLTYNNINVEVEITGKGNELEAIYFDGKQLPSVIIPYDISGLKKIIIKMGKTKTPYLKSANGKLYLPRYDKNKMSLEFTLWSFNNNQNEFEVVSPYKIVRILSNDKIIQNEVIEDKANGLYTIKVKHQSFEAKVKYKIDFK